MENEKQINRTKLLGQLTKIRMEMNFNIIKSKQMLTNLCNNIIKQKGVCFK